jgi:hypothetical protein
MILVLTCGTALADVPINVTNPNFSTPIVGCSGYAYQGAGSCSGTPTQNFSGFGWTFGSGGDGLTGAGTAFNPPAFDLFG